MLTTMLYSEAFPSDPMRHYFFDLKQGARGHTFLQISCSEKQRDGSFLRNRIVVFLRDLPLVVQALSSVFHHAAYIKLGPQKTQRTSDSQQQLPGLLESPLPDPSISPVKRLHGKGAGQLADEELLSLLFSAGLTDGQSLDLARKVLLSCGGLSGLAGASSSTLKRIDGVGDVRSGSVLAVVELARRLVSLGAL